MDDADDSYVPQISQMDMDHYGYANDLSADSYVPPPPQPGPDQYHPSSMQHQQLSGYYQQQETSQMMNMREKQPATPKGTKPKKRNNTSKKNAAAAALEMSPGPGMMAPGPPLNAPQYPPSAQAYQGQQGYGSHMQAQQYSGGPQSQQSWNQGQGQQAIPGYQQGAYYSAQYQQQMQQNSPSFGYRPMNQQQYPRPQYPGGASYQYQSGQNQGSGGYYQQQQGVHYPPQSPHMIANPGQQQTPGGYEQGGVYPGGQYTPQGGYPSQRPQGYPSSQQQPYSSQLTAAHPSMMSQHRMPTPTPLPAHPPPPNAAPQVEMRPSSQSSAWSQNYPGNANNPQVLQHEITMLQRQMQHIQSMPPSNHNQQQMHAMQQKVQFLQGQLQNMQSYQSSYSQPPARSPMSQMSSPVPPGPGSTQQISPVSQTSNPSTPAQASAVHSTPSIQVSSANKPSLMGPVSTEPPTSQYPLPSAPIVSAESLTPPPPPPGPSTNSTNSVYSQQSVVPPAHPLETEGMAVMVGRHPSNANSGGPPRVEVNIRPPANSETLITVYGYGNSGPATVSSAPTPPVSMTHASSVQTMDPHQHIPPEPMPPKISQPLILPPPVPMPIKPAPPPIPGSIFGLPPGPPIISSNKSPMVPFIKPPEIQGVTVNPETGIPIPVPPPAPLMMEPVKQMEPEGAVDTPSASNVVKSEEIITETSPILEEPSPSKRKRGFGSGAGAKKAAKKAKLSDSFEGAKARTEEILQATLPIPEAEVGINPLKRGKKLNEIEGESSADSPDTNVETQSSSPFPKPKRVRNRKKKTEIVVEESAAEPVDKVNVDEPDLINNEDCSMTTDVKIGVTGFDHPDSSATNTPTPMDKTNMPRYATKQRKPRKKKRASYESDYGESGDDEKKEKEKKAFEESLIPEDLLDKRRSSRNATGGRKKYKDEWDEVNLSGDEHVLGGEGRSKKPKNESEKTADAAQGVDTSFSVSDVALAPVVDKDTLVVEKILSERIHKVKNESTGEMVDEEQFYVKFKNFSYLHCAWKNAGDLEEGDKRMPQKLKRFKLKRESATTFLDEQYDEDEPFNPDFIQVERVLDVQYIQPILNDKGEEIEPSNRLFLVKWRSLQYEECTWEEEKDVDKDKIALFFFRKDIPPEKKKERARPTAADWQKVMENPVFRNGNQLRDYQLEGLNWLTFCWYNKQNCILADEMGLGKTIQTITFLCQLVQYGIRGPFLVVAPLSTIHNWQREFEEWSDINAVVYHGNAKSRQIIHDYELYYKNQNGDRLAKMYKFDVLVTTYEMVIADVEELREIAFRVCVIDEAHRLKNRNCKLLSGFNQFKMETRVLLTGTPLQNNVDELFSLLNFLEAKRFSSSEMFLQEFGTCQSDDQVSKLQEILKPMMLRRLKEDVEKTLAPKEETIIEVELTNMQKKYYRAILERNFSHLAKGTSAPSLMNTMMELRKCCNHPFLINGAEDNILLEYKDTHPNMNNEEQFQHALIHSSGKLVLIDKLLPRLRQNGHKILVFSQMVRVLDLIEEYLINRKYPFERIDGNVRGDLRQTAIDRFSKPDSDRFVFLLCTRAGGLGINLTAADTCIIFDSDWNPQNDLQAQARCHRIGQEKHVKIYRLITRNTYEREMFDKASLKLGLDKAVLQSMGSKENMAAQLSKKEVEDLLKKGAYGAIMDEETNEGDKFCEEDIDQILQRRTQTITIQAGVKGSKFAKASFNVSSNRNDIDINDKDFWQKWAKKANVDLDTDPNRELIIYEPRTRKRRFGDDDMFQQISEDSQQSDSDEEAQKGRKGKRRGAGFGEDTDYAPDELAFSKTDYFKVEKYLSLYGWGRWKEILSACELKQDMTTTDIEHMCRTVLLHCLREYSGDEKMKEFIWNLIPPHNAQLFDKERKGSSSTRKGKKNTRQSSSSRNQAKQSADTLMDVYHQGWAALPAYNPPVLAVDFSYKRHLQRHANKLLLRLRMLHFLWVDVITVPVGKTILDGLNAKECDIKIPWHPELPVYWWDKEADKSLLIAIFKLGYENVHLWRMDPALCFMSRCGPVEGLNEEDLKDKEEDTGDDEGEEEGHNEEGDEDSTSKKKNKGSSKKKSEKEEKREQLLLVAQMAQTAHGFLPFPTLTECNARFRRLMTLLQRTANVKGGKDDIRQQKKYARQEHIQTILQEREVRRLEERQRWTRREEMDFYRTIVSFGIETRANADPLWGRFKRLARLECKFDQTMNDYYTAFQAMSKRILRKPLSEIEERLSHLPESLSEERINKVNMRLELMNKIRTTLKHNHLLERIAMCNKTNDLPIWWEAGKHDLDLLRAVAKHGLSRSEDAIVQDPEFSFLEIWEKIQKGDLRIDPTSLNEKAIKENSKKTGESLKDLKAETLDDLEKKEELVRKLLTGEIASEDVAKKEDDEELKTTTDDAPTAAVKGEVPDEEKSGKSTEKPVHLKKEESVIEEKGKDVDVKEANESMAPHLAPMNQTTTALNWPKERMLVYRLQNICFTIEHGEYPSASTLKQGYVNVATPGATSQTGSEDIRSLTPDTPSETPYSLGGDSRGDSPFLGATTFAKSQVLEAMQRSGTPKIRRGRKPKSQTPNPATNTLQELMEQEKERMRALMHQTFLQQLEQNPLASLAVQGIPFPFGMGQSETGKGKEDALNLSTKGKEKGKSTSSTAKVNASKQQEMEQALQSAQAAEIMAMSALGQDTRVPVLNLRDGTRRSGKDAPTLKNLALWLSQHPDFIIDAPPLPFAAEGISLEPGEIPRTSSKASTSAAKDTNSSANNSSQESAILNEKVNVINRKNGIKLCGSKAPYLKNLVMWLEKNPDWDVDPEHSKLMKKISKFPAKLLSRVHEPDTKQSSISNTAPTPPANIASSSASSSDPFANLFPNPGSMDPASVQLQMQMMLAASGNNPFANPLMGLAGMGPFGFPPELAAMAGLASPGASMPGGLASPHAALEMGKKEEKKSKDDKERSKNKSTSQNSSGHQQQSLFGSDQAAALAAAAAGLDPSFNPFLLAGLMPQTSVATSQPDLNSLFGMSPFLNASGLVPGLPANMAAMTQLQSLMGLQGMDALLGPTSSSALSMMGLSTPSSITTTAARSKTSTSSSSSKSKERSTTQSQSSSKGASGKLSALVSKLAEQANRGDKDKD